MERVCRNLQIRGFARIENTKNMETKKAKTKTTNEEKWLIEDADGAPLDLGVASALLEFDSEAEAQELIDDLDDPTFSGDVLAFPMKPVKKLEEKWMIEDRELEDGDPGRFFTNSWNDDPRLWSSEAEAQAYIDSGVMGGWFRPVKHDTRGIPMGRVSPKNLSQNFKITAASLRRVGNLPSTYKMIAKVSYTPRFQSWVTVAQMYSTTEGTTVASFISVEGAGPVEITASEYRNHILRSVGVHPDRGGYDSY